MAPMLRRHAHRARAAAWLAMLAMALQGFWPLLAQAKPRGAELVPVCTVDGVTHFIELPPGKSPLEQQASSHHEHCGLCVFGSDRSACASHAAIPALPVDEPATRIVADLPAPRLGFVASSRYPRAPPRAF